MDKLRLRYSKTGKARYISHLDLMSVMRRALTRAGVALGYTGGFNPHPYMSVALPLPVGVESLCELIDVGVTEPLLPDIFPDILSDSLADGLPDLINRVLPEGLEIREVYKQGRRFSEITWVGISGKLFFDTLPERSAAERLTQRFSTDNIWITKKSKRGSALMDIAPYIRDVAFSFDNDVTVNAVLSAQNPSISTENFMSAIKADESLTIPDFAVFTRHDVFDKDMRLFR